MDYTQSDAFSTDVATGHRIHQDSAAVTTEVSAQDINGIVWELLSLIAGSGQTPIPFDKTNPASYTQVYQAVQLLISAAVAANANSDFKASVRYATTGNIILSGLGTQAGGDWIAALNDGERILVKDQATGSDNGYLIAHAGAWTRATDADGFGELTSGASCFVEEGTTNAGTIWVLTTVDPITIGTTALLFERKDGSIPQNSQSANYVLQLSDANKHLLHPSADVTARTFTIPANSAIPFKIGTPVTFINQNGAGAITIAITTDTMRLAGAGTTGSRTLAANGIATALKISATEWIISGTGLT